MAQKKKKKMRDESNSKAGAQPFFLMWLHKREWEGLKRAAFFSFIVFCSFFTYTHTHTYTYNIHAAPAKDQSPTITTHPKKRLSSSLHSRRQKMSFWGRGKGYWWPCYKEGKAAASAAQLYTREEEREEKYDENTFWTLWAVRRENWGLIRSCIGRRTASEEPPGVSTMESV